ncbi:carboxypeptidase-like regulatory domain-containing protein [Mucilaginibacter myungsuensis]|uniref:Carboxypeptidase regulatory-like domain-containing protein n=1 Tax=Mucilaginibacter myungsuensis TaxID=649104 RepID=A0A929PXX4_9SPHI|nr:carboxypeptidase-like regulatory domain-containing protein [Mucilaginibacter myungsuensis]MBE9664308.1 hypothetical protein [Mucilaginibacter myungsuensis]MDN3597017.1 hypothetical protein [Mucilaginibacter myungsuensis]
MSLFDAGQAIAAPRYQTVTDSLKQIRSKFDDQRKRLPIEKVYLHTDKPYYNIGDTLWLKAYVTDGAKHASKYSGLLYIELNDDSTETVRQISIPIKEGLGMGQIPLPRKIFHEGGYTLRAYTNWQQNFGDGFFFTQRLYLGVPARATWLVKSAAALEHVGDKDRLDVDIKLNLGDRKPVSLSDVEVKIYEGRYYLFKENLRTGIDGSLVFSKLLKDKVDGRNLSIQISSRDKAFPNKVIKIPLVINRDAKIDLQFMPEGGKLVAGIPSVVGFKALGEDGNSIDIKASIIDSKGTKVADIVSFYKGMGSFTITPEGGQTYMVKLIGGRSNNKTYNLPAVNLIGMAMHVDAPEGPDAIKVNIKGSNNTIGEYYLTGLSAGRICYAEKVDLNNKEISIDKMTFPTGITRLTLFNGMPPVAERLIYIDHKDRLDIRITPNKTTYQKRDSVSLDIEVKDSGGIPVQGSFSLAVTDNTQVKPDTMGNFNITTNLLLRSELKGNIETPGYYVDRKDPKAWQALNNLLLTQGWTNYNWADVFTPTTQPKFAMEKDLSITGTLVNVLNKPVADALVILSSQKPQYTATAFTDTAGRYSFKNLPQTDSAAFFLQGNTKSGKNMSFGAVNVNRVELPSVPVMYRNPIMPWFVNSDTTQLNLVKRLSQKANFTDMDGEGTMLRNVNIRTAKAIKNSQNPYGPGMSDMSFDEQDVKESAVMNLWQLLRQKMPGLICYGYRFIDQSGRRIPLLRWGNFYINGAPPTAIIPPGFDLNIDGNVLSTQAGESDSELLKSVPAAVIKGIEVIYSTKFTNRSVQVGGGLAKPGYRDYQYAKIEITTNNGVGWYRKNSPGRAVYRPLPVMHPKEFYRPKYTAKGSVSEPDYRSTIHWEPQIYTDFNGKARVTFYTSDLPNNYTIDIQGMTPEGELGSAVLKFPEVKPELRTP